jgi:hypothetical protein
MRYLGLGQGGGGNPVVRVIGEASRRDVNIIMVIDRSGSLDTAGACDDVESASKSFVNMFANQRDRLGLITYGGSYRYDYTLTKTFKDSPTLHSKLGLIYPDGCSGWTGSAQAFWNGYVQLANLHEPGALNAILFFTDGRPNTVTAAWSLDSIGTPGNTNMTRCWDWEHNKKYDQTGYDPSNLRYTGYIATENGSSDGVKGHLADPMPTGDPGVVKIPDGYSGSAKSSSSDCWWRSDSNNVTRDVAFYPTQDMYGNSFFGWKSVTTFPTESPYAGMIDYEDGDSGLNAAINAIDNAANRVRNKELEPGVDVLVYAIGLGDLGPDQAELLQRVANDRNSPIFDETKPEGLYVFAPNPAALNEAFVRIASEILRYSI